MDGQTPANLALAQGRALEAPAAQKPVENPAGLMLVAPGHENLNLLRLTQSNLLDARLARPQTEELPPEKPYSYLGSWTAWGANQLGVARGSDFEKELVHYVPAFAKTAALFCTGGKAFAATAILYGLDEARPSDTLGNQAFDLFLGAGKGSAMKGLFHVTGDWKSVAGKGLVLGTGGRLTDVALSRSTYFDHKQGEYSWDAAGTNFRRSVLNLEAAGTDVMLFLAAAGATKYINLKTAGLLAENRLANTIATGGTFGVLSGSLEEIQRQKQLGLPVDYLKVLGRGLLKGGLDATAAIPGGLQARSIQLRENARQQVQASTTERPTDKPQVSRRDAQSERLTDATTTTSRAENLPILKADNFSSLSQLLGKTRSGVEKLPGTRSDAADPLHAVETPVRVQEILDRNGRVIGEVVMSEAYAGQLQAVSQLRTNLSRAGSPADKAEAVRRLNEHPLADRMLPEDVAHHLQNMPDRSVRRVILHDGNNPYDALNPAARRMYGVSDIGRSAPGEIVIFKSMSSHPKETANAQTGVLHEWAHELADRYPHLARLFESVSPQEAANHRSYAQAPQEAWPVNLAEGLLNPDAAAAMQFARSAPVKNLVLARALSQALADTPAADRSALHQQFVARANALQSELTQPALQALRQSNEYKANAILEIAGPTEGLKILAGKPTLELAYSGATDATLAQVSGLRHFVSADLRGNPGITDAGVSHLLQWGGLNKIDVTGTRVTDRGLNSLLQLRITDLAAGATGTGDAALQGRPLETLVRLNMSRTGLGDAGVSQLEHAVRMRWLMLDRTNVTDAAIPSLAKLRLLEDLNIYRTSISDEGARTLQALLPQTRIAHESIPSDR